MLATESWFTPEILQHTKTVKMLIIQPFVLILKVKTNKPKHIGLVVVRTVLVHLCSRLAVVHFTK